MSESADIAENAVLGIPLDVFAARVNAFTRNSLTAGDAMRKLRADVASDARHSATFIQERGNPCQPPPTP